MLNQLTTAKLQSNAVATLEACGVYPCDVDCYDQLVSLIVERTLLVEQLATFPLFTQGFGLCMKAIVEVESKLAPYGLV